jgi:hypothetical protein
MHGFRIQSANQGLSTIGHRKEKKQFNGNKKEKEAQESTDTDVICRIELDFSESTEQSENPEDRNDRENLRTSTG